MLFKCETCTFVMDSNVHGNRPCQMCGEEITKRIPLDRWDVVDADLLPSSLAIVQGTPPMADTSAPATKKKVPFKLRTIGGELLPCTCATCTFLAERRLKLKRAADAEKKKLTADADENKLATDAEEKTKRATDDDEKKRAAGAEEK